MHDELKLRVRTLMACIREKRTDDAVAYVSQNPDLIDIQTPLGTFLHIASDEGDLKLCKVLVKMGADVDAPDNISGASPLHRVAAKGNESLLSYFIGLGAKLDISEPDRNPLFTAIHYGHLNTVRLLVAAGIDTSVRYTGRTMKNMGAVEFAHEWGREDIADYLESIA